METNRTQEAGNKPAKEKKAYSITVKANKKGKHINAFLNLIRCVVIPPFFFVKPFRYFGEKKIPEGACVFICNHYALLDPVYVAALNWESVHFVAKKDLTKNAIMRFFMKHAKVIPVARDGSDARGLLDCFKCLKNGEKVCIFPEGTRNKTGEEMLPFHPGAAVMAIKCKAPIVPLVIYKRPKLFRFAHVLLGEPMEFPEYYGRKLNESELAEVESILRQRMMEMKKAHEEYLNSKKKKA